MILLSPIEMGPSSSPRVIDFQVAQKRRDLEKIPTSLGGAIILTIWRGPFTADALRHVAFVMKGGVVYRENGHPTALE